MWCVAKDPDRNVALDRREARQAGAAKRQRGVERTGGVMGQRGLPKPLAKEAVAGGSTGAGGSSGQQDGGDSRPVITDEEGQCCRAQMTPSYWGHLAYPRACLAH